MQWSKVKSILIAALLIVNTFLLGNLLSRSWQATRRDAELMDHMRRLLAADGILLSEDFRLPADRTLPLLSIDRSRADEQSLSLAMLGEDATRSESEDGTVRFESEDGYIVWDRDGTVQGEYSLETSPTDTQEMEKTARKLFRKWGVWKDHARLEVVGHFVTLTSTTANLPVHNRSLTLFFSEDGKAVLTGFWSFGTPYAYAGENGVVCAAADALLAFAETGRSIGRIDSMESGYRLQLDNSGRLQLLPTWKIGTDGGEYLVDCAKKTPI